MFGDFNIISAQNDIYDLNVAGSIEQRNSFTVHIDTDLNIKTITELSVLLYDTIANVYIDCFVYYSRRDISIIPKTDMLTPGRKYDIVLKSGDTGVKDVFGYGLESDLIYEISFNNNIILKRPIINSPVSNSDVNEVKVSLNFNDATSCLVEIDDNINFSSPLFSKEVTSTDFTPAFAFEEKQYFIRAKSKKSFIDESTGATLIGESAYTNTTQFYFVNPSSVSPTPSPTPSTINIIKQNPEDGESLISNNAIMILTNTDLSSLTVDIKVYSSEIGMYDFYKNDIQSFVDAGILTVEAGTPIVTKNLIRFTLDSVKLSTAYYIVVKASDTTSEVFSYISTFTTASRYLYVDYEYMKSSVSNFDVTREYVLDKVQKACDMADYVSLARIRTDNIKFKVKEYVKTKALLDMVIDYQLGYIQMMSGQIGSFQFQLSGANVTSITEAVKYLQGQLKYWEATLKGYEKPGNAAPEYAQRSAATGPSRSVL